MLIHYKRGRVVLPHTHLFVSQFTLVMVVECIHWFNDCASGIVVQDEAIFIN